MPAHCDFYCQSPLVLTCVLPPLLPRVDIHAVVEEDPIVNAIHRNAEVFDPKAESVFRYLQVFSAICVIFSHGGPLLPAAAASLPLVTARCQHSQPACPCAARPYPPPGVT